MELQIETIILLEEIVDELNQIQDKLHKYMDKIGEHHPNWSILDNKQRLNGHTILDIEEILDRDID